MNIAGWEELYRAGNRGNEDTPTPLLVQTVANLTPGTAIDLACGAGRNALYLAQLGWQVTAVDGSEKAIELVQIRSKAQGLQLRTVLADLADPNFTFPPDTFQLALIAFYLQRNLFEITKAAVQPGGLIIAIAHTPEPGEQANEKRVAPGELLTFFKNWEILWQHEGPSRDPAHHRPVAEIVARRP